MKILHINTEKTWRGGEQQTFYLLKGLKQAKICSHLICQPDSPMAKRSAAAGYKIFTVPMHGEADLPAILKIRKLIKKNRYNIIHSHTSHAHTLAFFASLGIDNKLLVSRRVDFSIFRHSFLKLSGIKYRFMADYYVAISHKIKEVLVSDGIDNNRIFVAHSGIDMDRFNKIDSAHLKSEFNIMKNEKIVINVAHLAEHKGQKYLIKAIPAVLDKIPDVRFFIIGGGKLINKLKTLADSLKLNNRLIFTGFREDVGAFYKLADLFVMSSIEEGLGTSVLDALAIDKPVVATSAGGIPEIIKDGVTGRLVSPGDAKALADGIIKMFLDPEKADKMAENGGNLVTQNFSINAMVSKNIEIYRHIAPEWKSY